MMEDKATAALQEEEGKAEPLRVLPCKGLLIGLLIQQKRPLPSSS